MQPLLRLRSHFFLAPSSPYFSFGGGNRAYAGGASEALGKSSKRFLPHFLWLAWPGVGGRVGGGPHLVRRHAHPSLGCASMRVFSGVRSLGDGYLALNPGDEIDVQYWGRTERGDENCLFCLKHSTGERGWCSAACLSVWARVAFSSLGGGYLGLSQGDEVRVAYVGSRKQGDDGWLYGTAYATGEEGWFDSKCCWARPDLAPTGPTPAPPTPEPIEAAGRGRSPTPKSISSSNKYPIDLNTLD